MCSGFQRWFCRSGKERHAAASHARHHRAEIAGQMQKWPCNKARDLFCNSRVEVTAKKSVACCSPAAQASDCCCEPLHRPNCMLQVWVSRLSSLMQLMRSHCFAPNHPFPHGFDPQAKQQTKESVVRYTRQHPLSKPPTGNKRKLRTCLQFQRVST